MVSHKRYDLWLKRMDLTCKWDIMVLHKLYDTDGLAQDCRNSSALAMELQQTYAKPSVCNQQQNGSDLQMRHLNGPTQVNVIDDIHKYNVQKLQYKTIQ